MAIKNISYCFFILYLFKNINCLSPIETESREIFSLNGLWNFIAEKYDGIGIKEKYYNLNFNTIEDNILMAVPSSYNDITQNPHLRDHIGVVWYQKCDYIPNRFIHDKSTRKVLYFASVNYYAKVWINGQFVTRHEGGHLPFEVDLTKIFKKLTNSYICITVSVNNTLTASTIPQGRIFKPNNNQSDRYPPNYKEQKLEFDFFNYAGIHRSVLIYTTPVNYINDITISTDIKKPQGENIIGKIKYEVKLNVEDINVDEFYYNIFIYDANNNQVSSAMFLNHHSGYMEINNVNLWWPHLFNGDSEPAYLYTLKVEFVTNKNYMDSTDIYRLKFGIRSLKWTNTNIFINDRPFYLYGFGRHEDLDVKGRGLDPVLVWHDGYLMKWIGANSYRTSHYPYSEESLDVADHFGFVVIAETPAIGLNLLRRQRNYRNFTRNLLKKHLEITQELINRDKNRASVIIWSLSNEPLTQIPEADLYFKDLAGNVSIWDNTRPKTFVTSQNWLNDVAVKHMDIVCFNRYAGWYNDPGRLDLVQRQTYHEIRHWYEKFNKPVLIAEYGAGAISGLHSLPSFIWTEDYQSSVMYKHFAAFDKLYTENFFLGEMVWNFADFATPQEVIRPTGCMKGVFTRNRYPKQVAHILRKRYWNLAIKNYKQYGTFNEECEEMENF